MMTRKWWVGFALATLVTGTVTGCTNYDEELRRSVIGALVIAHERSVLCVQDVLRGELDSGRVPGGVVVWSVCFSRDPQTGEGGADLVKSGAQLRWGSWLIDLASSAQSTQIEVIDVGEASVDRGADGPIYSSSAQCWTANVDLVFRTLRDVQQSPCPADALVAAGGAWRERPDFVTRYPYPD